MSLGKTTCAICDCLIDCYTYTYNFCSNHTESEISEFIHSESLLIHNKIGPPLLKDQSLIKGYKWRWVKLRTRIISI